MELVARTEEGTYTISLNLTELNSLGDVIQWYLLDRGYEPDTLETEDDFPEVQKLWKDFSEMRGLS